MKYKINLKGYDTLEPVSIDKQIELEAKNEDEAEIKAKEWCKTHSFMGGYDWDIKGIHLIEEICH